jgi:23S rRNA (guanosine2251-2'-O)-methyltransferase
MRATRRRREIARRTTWRRTRVHAAVDGLVLVVPSEGRGLPRLVGEHCDRTVRIPMAGLVDSLNVGVDSLNVGMTGIALAEVVRRCRTL